MHSTDKVTPRKPFVTVGLIHKYTMIVFWDLRIQKSYQVIKGQDQETTDHVGNYPLTFMPFRQ